MGDEDFLLDEEGLSSSPEDSEGEDDLTELDPSVMSQAFVTASDWTTETILNQLERGNIILNPRFQRRDAWRPPRKSKFIESIILGLPVPQLVLAEPKGRKGYYIVIDGKQRLLSIRQFAAKEGDSEYDKLKLTGLEIRKDLNGKALSDLEQDASLKEDLSAFQNETIRTVVVRNWPNEKYLYLVFLRLNTGSVQLSPQELRQALHPGKFVDFADEYSAQSNILQQVLRLTKPDFRMRDVELLIRYYAFRNFLSSYSGNLKDFLDLTCKTLNDQWNERENELRGQADDFDKAIDTTIKIFEDKQAFRRWDGYIFQPRFNRAVFDIMIFYFVHPSIREKALSKREYIFMAFKKLCEDYPEFRRSIETTTKSLEATFIRLSYWGDFLSKILELDIKKPKLIDNRMRLQ